MLLTANNHAGDTMASGITRTVEIIRGKGLTALGSPAERRRAEIRRGGRKRH